MIDARSRNADRHLFIDRRAFAVGVLASAISCGSVKAEAGRPIQVVVPYAAGGPLDTVARIVAKRVSELTSEVLIVVDRPGANGDVGARAVVDGPADGSEWLFTSDAIVTVNPALYSEPQGYDAERDLKVVAVVGALPSILVVNPNFKVKTVREFVDFARVNEVNYASGGVGSAGHLTMEYFGSIAGLNLRHIPYRGAAPAMTDLLGGQVQAAFLAIGGAIEAVKSNRLRALAVSSKKRVPMLPSVPTVIESGYPDFVVQTAYFVMVPTSTPEDASRKAESELGKALADPQVQDRLNDLGIVSMDMTPGDAVQWLATEKKRWTKLIRERGISGAN